MGLSSCGKVSFAQVADKLLWVLVAKRLRSEVLDSVALRPGLAESLYCSTVWPQESLPPVLSAGPRLHPAHTYPELATAHTGAPCPEAALHGIRSPVRKSDFLPIAEHGKVFA